MVSARWPLAAALASLLALAADGAPDALGAWVGQLRDRIPGAVALSSTTLGDLLPASAGALAQRVQLMLLHVEHWILIVTSAYLAARFTARVHERRLLAARAAMRHARMRDARFTSVETGALEWINHVLRHEWRAVIGARVDAQAGATLASVLADAPAMTAGVVRDAEVDACTLGVVPPDLNLYVSRFDPIAEYLQFEFDLDWRTVSSHIVIGATIKPTAFVPAVRIPIHVTDFAIKGRLLVGFRLARRPPGVSGVDVSFDAAPDVDVAVRPMGAPVSDLPGVHEFIKAKIASVFASNYVEPRRYYHDVEGPWLRSAGAGAGTSVGTGGALIVDVAGARRLRPVDVDGQRKTTANAYVELTYAGVTRTTATRLKTLNPDWNVRVAFPLCDDEDADEGRRGRGGGSARPPPEGEFGSPPDHHRRGADRVAAGANKTSASSSGKGLGLGLGLGRRSGPPLRVRVMDWSPLGEPRCVASATVPIDLARLRRARREASAAKPETVANAGGPLGLEPLVLPLRGTRDGELRIALGAAPPPPEKERENEKEKEKAAFFARDGTSNDDAATIRRRGDASSAEERRVARSGSGTRLADALVDVWGDDLLDDDGNYVGGGSDDDDDDELDDAFDGSLDDDRSSRRTVAGRRTSSEKTRRLFVAAPSPRGGRGHPSPAAGMGTGTPSPSAATPKHDTSAAAASMLRLARVEKRRREEAARHAAATKALKARFRGAREDARLERERRDAELRRALIEGAAFVVHTKRKPGFDPGTFRMWYSTSKGQLQWSAGTRVNAKSKLHQFVPASLVRECVPGVGAFTLGAPPDPDADEGTLATSMSRAEALRSPVKAARGAARRAADAARALALKKKVGINDPRRCFSLVLWKPDEAGGANVSDNVMSSGAAGLGLATIDLELPEGGNGRSAREWCDAVYAVALEHGGGRVSDSDASDEDASDEEEEEEEGETAIEADVPAMDDAAKSPGTLEAAERTPGDDAAKLASVSSSARVLEELGAAATRDGTPRPEGKSPGSAAPSAR